MKTQLMMSYGKVPKIAPRANSVLNILARQQCALRFLEIYKSRKRWISIDKSFIVGFYSRVNHRTADFGSTFPMIPSSATLWN